MKAATIPPRNDHYIVGYAGQIPKIRDTCGNTFGDTQRLLSQTHKPNWPSKDVVQKNWPPRGRHLIRREANLLTCKSLQPTVSASSNGTPPKMAKLMTDSLTFNGSTIPTQTNTSLPISKKNLFDQRRCKTELGQHPILQTRNSSKYIAGYSAHIPKYVNQVGATFTETAHTARWEFQKKHNRPETAKKVLNPSIVRSSTSLSETFQPVSKAGVIPNYGGHIAGYKFRFGGSFAKLTDLKLF